MNPTEIADALEEIAARPFDGGEFPFAFAAAMGSPQATVSKLRSGTINKSKVPGAVLMNRKFYAMVTEPGAVDQGLSMIRSDKKTTTHKPAILLATDGVDLSAEHVASGDSLHIKFADLHHHFGFFLPAAGMSRYKAAEENEVDVKAAGRLAKLYDALLKKNPDWKTPERRHDLNQLMTRLIFCMFAEDVGIFDNNLFSRLIFTHAGDKGEEAQSCIASAFAAMNLPKGQRQNLPAWADAFPYVNGGLFADTLDVPKFDRGAYRYLQDACQLDWQEINPDIFGSMIQSVADPDKRSELGMHYTSVPNILKVLGPLFLDDLDEQIEKAGDSRKAQARVLKRIEGIRVFDPACGSGNFLVVAYRELRAREMRVLERLAQLDGGASAQMFSGVRLANFYGIEITDFAAETAKLALFIAEYQANARFGEMFGNTAPALPLRDGGNIVCDNALRLDWEGVCPPPGENEEVFIAGNPPFVGFNSRTPAQSEDMRFLLADRLKSFERLDLVICWFIKAADYIRGRAGAGALVSTNSIAQGVTVNILWPEVLREGIRIHFAHRPFMWSNNAAKNAAVSCVVVGISSSRTGQSIIFDGELRKDANNINGYLLDAPDVTVAQKGRPIFPLPKMDVGSIARDEGNLIFSETERNQLVSEHPEAAPFIRRYMGAREVAQGLVRYCLWAETNELDDVRRFPPLAKRLDAVAKFRSESDAQVTRDAAAVPHRFGQITGKGVPKKSAILMPRTSSSRRPYLPVELVGSDVVASADCQIIFDPPDWCFAILASKLQWCWVSTVSGRMKNDFRYSSTLCWHVFPIPRFTEDQLEALNASARAILKTRYMHHPKTIAQLYDPDDMPDDLREVHRQNDELLETMYIGRPFRNDTERLERLFKLYAARIEKLKKEEAPKRMVKSNG
ncbi:type II restriction/modification system DNA methylase subunit YeeA [Aliiruegeria haliotis]|uniref:site-specific DNA-methyltransferase (adenine-specific) n=1 Tax=Aliiruegeria haliotis TaxID=1280846 RepID=A0A2T0RGY1_9RHOB|nr:DNA methyltransferase [Aliiruegeria haliotis]PRY20466.1 type II restriction/modification system DNA methylase subunit YeeA [Aliiruegeria haliotis]